MQEDAGEEAGRRIMIGSDEFLKELVTQQLAVYWVIDQS